MDGRMCEGLGTFIVLLMVFGVFGIWKVIEIIIWLFTHVSISF